jgi:lipid A 3-O-deacylase
MTVPLQTFCLALLAWRFVLGMGTISCIDQKALVQTSSEDAGAVPGVTLALAPSQSHLRENCLGNRFRSGTMQVGFGLGAGIGTKVFGSRHAHDLALLSAHFGRIFTAEVGKGHWYRGNWEWLGELWGGWQLRPNQRQLFGLTSLIRYNFVTGSCWVPFVNLGAGFSYSDIRGRDLSTEFNFNLQLGAGAHYFLRKNTALTLQYRWFHLSNAGIKLPNNGTNTQMFFAGLSWFF